MANCNVVGCGIQRSGYHPKITLHKLPANKEKRQLWLESIGVENVKLSTKKIYICSLHFEESCFNRTQNKVTLRANALPSRTLLACRICLVMDAKLVSMRVYQLEQDYENLTGLSLSEEDKLPQTLCMECVQRLLNCSQFRLKSLRANSLMLEVINNDDYLTAQNIKAINRLNNQLTSSLSTKHFEVNHYDYEFKYEDQPILSQDDSLTTAIVDIGEEYEILTTEEVPDKNYEELIETGVNESEFDDDGITDTDVLNEKDDDSEKEYVLSDKDNYSSDDSLQFEKYKTKKAIKRKKLNEKPVKAAKIAKEEKESTEQKLETFFTITNMTFEEKIAEIVKRKESLNYKNAVFKCSACFKGYLDKNAFNSHISKHTNQFGEQECEICKLHFKDRYTLRRHVTAFHTQKFSCNQCTYETTNRQTARLHERWHSGTKYRCPHCQDEFLKFSTYMGHIRIKHPSDDFVCGLCGYSFISAKGLEQHKKLKHRLDNVQIPEDGPLCELCNVRFISSEAHKQHLSVSPRHNIGTDNASRKPNAPPKVVNSVRQSYEGPIPCEQCGLQLKNSRAYHGHFRRMHPDKNRTKYPAMKSPFMCEMCGRIFQNSRQLKDHAWVHTAECPFKCDSCSKSFRTEVKLLAHKHAHTRVGGSYVCEFCGKIFPKYRNRERHMLVHTSQRPYKCEICGKGFKRVAEKRAHIQYVHLKKPWPKRTRGKRRPDTTLGQLSPRDQDTDSQASMSPPCDANDEDMEMETVDMSQASMSPPCSAKDEDLEMETVDMSPMIEDESFIYILTVD